MDRKVTQISGRYLVGGLESAVTLHFSNARGRRRDASGPSPSLRIGGLNGRCYLRGDEAHNTGPEPDLQMHLCEHRARAIGTFEFAQVNPPSPPLPLHDFAHLESSPSATVTASAALPTDACASVYA
jgi:hypothetical protein